MRIVLLVVGVVALLGIGLALAWGPIEEHMRLDVARDLLAALAERDREAFAEVSQQGGSERDFARCAAAVAHVDAAHPTDLVARDDLVLLATFADGWSLEIPVVMSDGGARFVARLTPRHTNRYEFPPVQDDPAAEAVLAAAHAARRDDRGAFDALLADDAPPDAYATTRASVADRALDALEVAILTGTDDALVAELLVDDDAGRRQFIAALRRESDGAWRLVSPIVH